VAVSQFQDLRVSIDGIDFGTATDVALPTLKGKRATLVAIDEIAPLSMTGTLHMSDESLSTLQRWASAPRRRFGHPHGRPLPRLSN
jgi:hypothetical protein